MKPVQSCTPVDGSRSSSAPVEGAGALWVAVLALAVAWWSPASEAVEVRAWLRLAGVIVGGGSALEALARAAERCRTRAPWALAWGVRAATGALVVEARSAGRWPRWRAIPFALGLYVHPLTLAPDLLEAAALTSGRSVEDARAAWRELARLHGVCA